MVQADDITLAAGIAAASAPEPAEWITAATEAGPCPQEAPTSDNQAALQLAHRINTVFEQAGTTAQSLAIAAAAIAKTPIITFPPPPQGTADTGEQARGVRVETAYFLISQIAMCARLTTTPLKRDIILRLLSEEHIRHIELASFIEASFEQTASRPLVTILTPLSQVTQEEQLALVQKAQAARAALEPLGVQVVIPGELLTPRTCVDTDRRDLYLRERKRIFSASLVVVIVDHFDSWGAAQCVEWAEGNGAYVIVFMSAPERLSRVNGGSGAFRTEVRPEAASGELAECLARFVEANLSALRVHHADLVATQSRVEDTLLELQRRSLRAFSSDIPHLTEVRTEIALGDALELRNCTAFELSALIRELGDAGANLVKQLLGLDGDWRPSAVGDSPRPTPPSEDSRPGSGD